MIPSAFLNLPKTLIPRDEQLCDILSSKNTKEIIFKCPSIRPCCDYADYKYENVGCCGEYDDSLKTKSDCAKLSDLLNQ